MNRCECYFRYIVNVLIHFQLETVKQHKQFWKILKILENAWHFTNMFYSFQISTLLTCFVTFPYTMPSMYILEKSWGRNAFSLSKVTSETNKLYVGCWNNRTLKLVFYQISQSSKFLNFNVTILQQNIITSFNVYYSSATNCGCHR